MGTPYEFNWYLVIEDEERIKKTDCDKLFTIKSEYRIYPINMPIPLIIKEKGCIGLVVIKSFKVDNTSTKIEFYFVEKYDIKNEIAQHYYNLYLHMKNNV